MQDGHMQFSPAVVGGTLSNQRLEAGREVQQVVGQTAACCGSNSSRPGRFFKKTRIIAFADLISYQKWVKSAERHNKSRPCPSVTSITINVASVTEFLALGEVANPLSAHSGYGCDDRVGVLPARGAGEPNVVPIAAERCRWRETDGNLMQ
jgi:hypothetical protein